MYLSRVEIDVANRQKLKDLSHLGAYHSWVEQCFSSELQRHERSRKLWRIDPLQDKLYLLVVSELAPNLQKLEKYGVEGTGQTVNYDEFLNSLTDGLLARFRVTLNPVQSISSGKQSGKRGRVVPHVTVAQQLGYLEQQATKHGFELVDNHYEVVNRTFRTLKYQGDLKPVQISQVSYQGLLKITDAQKIKSAMTLGIGKKKAYGCGLLTLIPVNHDK